MGVILKTRLSWIPKSIRARHQKRVHRAIVAVLVLLALGTRLFRESKATARRFNATSFPTQKEIEPTVQMANFLGELAVQLKRNHPKTEPIFAFPMERDLFDPAIARPDNDTSNLVPPMDLPDLRQSHHNFVAASRDLVRLLPFEANKRGVVMTANPAMLGVAILSILMLRRSGSRLPVQIFIDSMDKRSRQSCDRMLANLDVQCVNMDQFLKLLGCSVSLPAENNKSAKDEYGADPLASKTGCMKASKFQLKVFALIFSSFQDAIFFDADVFLIHNPDALLDSEPYLSYGLVTWPDFWLPTVSHEFYEITETNRSEITNESRASESGFMLYDKSRHADSLLLSAYYNYYGPSHYYPLLSQGAWGQGDKETYLKAAQVLGRPVWDVKTFPGMISSESINYGSGIRQVDPRQDLEAYSQRLLLQARQAQGETVTNIEWETVTRPRWLFAHLNRVKINILRLKDSVGDIIFTKNMQGRYQRLWGEENATLVDSAGYDVEKSIWDVVLEVNCQKKKSEECKMLRLFYNEVFAGCA